MSVYLRQTTAQRVYKIAKQLNIPQTTVESIIKAYHNDLKESVGRGEEILFEGIFRINMYQGYDNVVARGSVSSALREKLRGVKTLPILPRLRDGDLNEVDTEEAGASDDVQDT
jgi:hypothetical protein